jgi:hypothetical protein
VTGVACVRDATEQNKDGTARFDRTPEYHLTKFIADRAERDRQRPAPSTALHRRRLYHKSPQYIPDPSYS